MRFIAAFIIVVSAFLYGCAGSVFKPIAPEIEVTNVKLSAISFPMTNVMFTIEVTNPNDFDIHVTSIDIKLHVMDHLITTENWSNIEVLRSRQKQNMRVPVTINILNTLALLPQFMSETNVPYMVSGTAKLKNYHKEMLFKYEGDFNVAQMQGVTQNIKHDNSEKRIHWF